MRFYDAIMDNFLTQHQTSFTRVRGKDKPSCIDLIITDDGQTQVKPTLQVTAPIGLSDHAVLEWQYLLSTKCEDTSENTPIKKKNYNKGNYESMKSILNEKDWEQLLKDKPIDEQLKVLLDEVNNVANQCIPEMTNKKANSEPPWMSKKARKQLKKKQCAWKRYCQSKSYQKYLLYTKERNKSAFSVKKAKKDYEKKISEECKKNPKVLFQYVNYKNKSKKNIIRLKDKDGNIVTKDEENATILNNYFSSVYTVEDDAPEIIISRSAKVLERDDNIEDPFDIPEALHTSKHLSNIVIEEDDIIRLLKDIDPF